MRRLLLLLLLAIILSLLACATDEQNDTLRLVVLPVVDSLPLYVADARGYFKEEGISVTLVPAATIAEQERLIQGDAADGLINTLLSTMLFNRDGIELVTVSYARKATSQYPYTYVLASPSSQISTLEDLEERAIGVTQRSMEAYIIDRLLEEEGFSPDEVDLVAAPAPEERPALLSSGQLPVTVLSDPLAALAQSGGAINVIDDSLHPQYGYSVLSFRREVSEKNGAVIRALLRALSRAVDAINEEKRPFYTLLQEHNVVAEELAGAVRIPDFPSPAVPPATQWDDLLRWAQEKGYVDGPIPYQGSVNPTFLP